MSISSAVPLGSFPRHDAGERCVRSQKSGALHRIRTSVVLYRCIQHPREVKARMVMKEGLVIDSKILFSTAISVSRGGGDRGT